MAEQKTNVMRILDKAKIPYEHYLYKSDGQIDGVHVAEICKIPPEKCFKTLVTSHTEKSGKKEYFVFVIPVAQNLDLKAAAKSVGAKNVEMLHVKDLLPVTGYIRGGCSPIGMKKQFKTVIHISAENLDFMTVSGGKIGAQVRLAPTDLVMLIGAEFADICEKK